MLPTLNGDGSGTGWSCIWDAGGSDTISNQNSSGSCQIYLTAAPLTGTNAGGYVSWVGGIAGGFTIANNVVIENAIGGSANDYLVGNDFANILNRNIINYEVVNYGVGGYQAEQAFLRYFKNKDHDLKYVFYFFMLGDQESYKLLTFKDNNQYTINKVKINPIFQMLGKLNITYLSIDAFLKLRILIYNDYSSIKKNNYPELMANQIANKNKIGGVFDMNHFAKLIETFQKTVESNNAEFFVILYPNKDHINYFQESIKLRNLKVNYFVLDNSLVTEKKFKFKNDDHWNEFGNLHFARNIKNFLNTNLKIIFENEILVSN
jgi:hypothetical protein